jgi:hypothetical protein
LQEISLVVLAPEMQAGPILMLHLEPIAMSRLFGAVAADCHAAPAARACWWERARDLTVLMDQIETQGEFAGRLDGDRNRGI